MTEERSFERRITAWLENEAPTELPDRVLEAAFVRARKMPRRSALLWWRSPMTRIQTATLAVGAAAIVVIAAGFLLLPRNGPQVGAPAHPGPSATVATSPSRSAPSASAAASVLAPISVTGEVAFAATVVGNTDIYLMHLDRTGLVRLTDDPAVDAAPAWSPDGTRIVFTRGTDEGRDVYVMDADGSNVTQLTDSVEGEDSAAFSPDGSKIAFSRYVDPTFFDMWVMNADGSNGRRVWHKDGVFAQGPRWSADGKALLFNEDETGGGGIDIVKLDLASNRLIRIAAEPGDDSSFSISSDASRLAFQSDRAPGGLFVMNADGSNIRHLTGTWNKGAPSTWSPDDKYILYEEPGVEKLFLIPIAGGEAVFWTSGRSPAWRPTP